MGLIVKPEKKERYCHDVKLITGNENEARVADVGNWDSNSATKTVLKRQLRVRIFLHLGQVV